MLSTVILSLMLAQAPAPAPSPAGEVLSALADARRLPAEQCRQTRYLTLYSVPAEKRAEFAKVLAFHVNSLSREAELYPPRRVTATLYALEIDQYGWQGTTYGPLATIDPWFHAQATDGKTTTLIHAPWLPTKEILELSILTGSVVPILRADWFVYQTGEQENRKAGYYDFLGVKNIADVEKLAGLDKKAAQQRRKELAAIVIDSAVALNNRQIFEFDTVGGEWYESRDAKTSVGKSNAVRNLDGDYEFQAREIYFTLSNGLFGLALADDKGKIINKAPDDIASDSESTNQNRAVRIGISCIRCHKEGLRPIEDFARRAFMQGGETALGSPDREKARRLKQLYLGPLELAMKRSRERYAETLKTLTGMKPEEMSKAYADAWKRYESDPILPADAAREMGVTEKELIDALRDALKKQGLVDLAFAGWLAVPPIPLRREIFEEQVSVLMPLIQKVKP